MKIYYPIFYLFLLLASSASSLLGQKTVSTPIDQELQELTIKVMEEYVSVMRKFNHNEREKASSIKNRVEPKYQSLFLDWEKIQVYADYTRKQSSQKTVSAKKYVDKMAKLFTKRLNFLFGNELKTSEADIFIIDIQSSPAGNKLFLEDGKLKKDYIELGMGNNDYLYVTALIKRGKMEGEGSLGDKMGRVKFKQHARESESLIVFLGIQNTGDVSDLKKENLKIIGIVPFNSSELFKNEYKLFDLTPREMREAKTGVENFTRSFISKRPSFYKNEIERKKALDTYYTSNAVKIASDLIPDSVFSILNSSVFLDSLASFMIPLPSKDTIHQVEAVNDHTLVSKGIFTKVVRTDVTSTYVNEDLDTISIRVPRNFVIRFEKKQSGLSEWKISQVVYKNKNIKPKVWIKVYIDPNLIVEEPQEEQTIKGLNLDSICIASALNSSGSTKVEQWLNSITLPNDSLLSGGKKVEKLFYDFNNRKVFVSSANKPNKPHKEYSIAHYYQHLEKLPYSNIKLQPSIANLSSETILEETNIWKATISFHQNFGGLSRSGKCKYCDYTLKNIEIYIIKDNGYCECFLGDIMVQKTIRTSKYTPNYFPKY